MVIEDFTGPLRAAGVTPRECEVFALVGERLHNWEIAQSLHLSERTVENHVSSLLRKLGAANRLALVEASKRFRAQRVRNAALPRPLSSFVGRTREIDDLRQLVVDHRLLTLTGPAGTGKTRLALHLAGMVTGLPPAALVDLASVPAGGGVERVFADALGVVGNEHRLGPLIAETLAVDSRWLIVDNCEHVSAGVAALLADVLAANDELHVLATSHGPLHVAGEVIYELEPLGLPDAVDEPDAVLDAASGRLFADRAAAVATGFTVTADNARDVAMICRRLDGLPLAIELAAARIRFFSPAELLALLNDRFALLIDGSYGSPSRHRTLEDALRWSYDLLDDDERLLFERCSVFPGDFDYDTAARILAYPPLESADLIRLLSRLLDRSLICHRQDRRTRYRLLDSVRQFAHRQLQVRGAAEAAREQHARHHLRHAVALAPDVKGGDQKAAQRWFEDHWADLRAAMRWVLEQPDTTPAWEFLVGIGTAWWVLGTRGELFDWLDALLERPLPEDDLGTRALVTCSLLLTYHDAERARLFAERAHARIEAEAGTDHDQALTLFALAWALRGGDTEAAIGHLENAARLFGRSGDDWHHAMTLTHLGFITPDVTTALTRLSRAAALLGTSQDRASQANCLNLLAVRALDERVRLDDVPDWLTEADRLARLSGNHHERLHAELYRACLDRLQGEHAAPEKTFGELLGEFHRIGDYRCMARCLHGLGAIAASSGDYERATEHLTQAIKIAVQLGDLRISLGALRVLADVEREAGHTGRADTLVHAAEDLDSHGFVNNEIARTALGIHLGANVSVRRRMLETAADQ